MVDPFQPEQQDSKQKEIRMEESSFAPNFAEIKEVALQQRVDSVNERTAATAVGDERNDFHAILEVLKQCSPYQVLTNLSLLNKRWSETASSSELWEAFGKDLEMPSSSYTHPKLSFAYCAMIQKQTVAYLSSKSVAFLDLETKAWESKALSVQTRNEAKSAYTVLFDGSLFCCGGHCYDYAAGTNMTIKDAVIIKRDGTVLTQPDLIWARYSHGVAAIGNKVFVFGGKCGSDDPKDSWLDTILHNEMFSQGQWTKLPDLKASNWNFSPCVCTGLIYIYGVYNGLEIFNPDTLSFSLIRVDTYLANMAMVHDDSLEIFMKSDLRTVDKLRSYMIRDLEICAMCRPAVVAGQVYVLGYNGYYVIDINTREKRGIIPYWRSRSLSEETSGLETGRNHYRSILEVLKMCCPSNVLSEISLLNKRWAEVAHSSELWLTFAEDSDLPYEDPEFDRSNLLRKYTVTALSYDSIGVFSPITKEWKSKPLSQKLMYSKNYVYALFSNGSLFCCGGDPEWRPSSSAYIIKRNGRVLPQPQMHFERCNHGVAIIGENVYVFGGWMCDKGHDLRLNERFVDHIWTDLPRMQHGRYMISTSVHKDLIYICGSRDPTVEVFNPSTLCFSLIPGLMLPSQHANITLVHEGCLVILTEWFITRWDIEKNAQETTDSQYTESLLDQNSRELALVRVTLVGNFLYIQRDFNVFEVIDVRTGKLRDFLLL